MVTNINNYELCSFNFKYLKKQLFLFFLAQFLLIGSIILYLGLDFEYMFLINLSIILLATGILLYFKAPHWIVFCNIFLVALPAYRFLSFRSIEWISLVLVFSLVIVGDIQVIHLPFPDGYFDYIVLGDGLEHLYNPWKTLNQLKGYLSSSGFIIASIPNISYWEILKDLILFNRWEYQEEGILDKAHLRFFTKRSMVEMMNKAGFEVESIVARRSLGIKAKLFNLFTLEIFRKFFESAYIIKGRKMRAC